MGSCGWSCGRCRADLIEQASITLPMLGRDLDAKGLVADAALSVALRQALADFADAIV